MPKRPTFTEEQEFWICDIIGAWYQHWKHRITDNYGPHRLGFAKEELKAALFTERDYFNAKSDDCFKDYKEGEPV